MTDVSQGPDWWRASDGLWYPPESHPAYVARRVPAPSGSALSGASMQTAHAPTLVGTPTPTVRRSPAGAGTRSCLTRRARVFLAHCRPVRAGPVGLRCVLTLGHDRRRVCRVVRARECGGCRPRLGPAAVRRARRRPAVQLVAPGCPEPGDGDRAVRHLAWSAGTVGLRNRRRYRRADARPGAGCRCGALPVRIRHPRGLHLQPDRRGPGLVDAGPTRPVAPGPGVLWVGGLLALGVVAAASFLGYRAAASPVGPRPGPLARAAGHQRRRRTGTAGRRIDRWYGIVREHGNVGGSGNSGNSGNSGDSGTTGSSGNTGLGNSGLGNSGSGIFGNSGPGGFGTNPFGNSGTGDSGP